MKGSCRSHRGTELPATEEFTGLCQGTFTLRLVAGEHPHGAQLRHRSARHTVVGHFQLNLTPPQGQDLPPGLKAVTVDVAVGGVLCACNLPIEPHAIPNISLTLVGGDLRQPATLDVQGRVRRCSERPGAPDTRHFEVALGFVRLDPQARQLLQGYLKSL